MCAGRTSSCASIRTSARSCSRRTSSRRSVSPIAGRWRRGWPSAGRPDLSGPGGRSRGGRGLRGGRARLARPRRVPARARSRAGGRRRRRLSRAAALGGDVSGGGVLAQRLEPLWFEHPSWPRRRESFRVLSGFSAPAPAPGAGGCVCQRAPARPRTASNVMSISAATPRGQSPAGPSSRPRGVTARTNGSVPRRLRSARFRRV